MKLFSIFFFCSVLLASMSAQDQPVQLWQAAEYVKSMNIKGPTISLDKFQNTYMLTNQTDESPFSGFTLVKYDTIGNVLWKRHSQPGIIGILYGSFTVDSLGNAYVGQWYDGGLPGYDADAVLIKYAPDGTKAWEANYGLDQSGDSYIYYSEIDTLNGRLITLGMNLHETDPAENFLFVQAVDTSDGSVIWRTKISGVFRPQNMRIQQEHIQLLSTQYKPDSKYFVNTLVDFDGNTMAQYEKPYSGYTIDVNYISKTGDVIFGNRSFGYNVTRVNVQGDTLWAYVHQTQLNSEENFAIDIVEDDSLFTYAIGAIETLDNYTEVIATKFSKEGETIWQETHNNSNGNFVDLGESLNIDNNYLYLAGKSQLENEDIVCIVIVLDKSNGHEKYNIIIKEKNATWSSDIITMKNYMYHAAIGFESTINNLLSLTTCIRLPCVSSAIDNYEKTDEIILSPNPTITEVRIEKIDVKKFKWICLFNQQGKTLTRREITGETESLWLNEYLPGVYIVVLEGEYIKLSKKVIKM
ncbi:MAG: T9SS type A sorting domain-containing protein [Saprospiraceae bacterium]|nr:T9SS type A sorting domain-containing protein [Saprospiraceae bacterium]